MPIQKTEAIVLKSQKLGETSKIITLYSRKYGKIKVVAKGARGLKSHFYGTLESLNYISVVFYFKEKRDLQLLSQADIIEFFSDIKNNLDKLSFAMIVSEIILRSQYAEESNPYLFKIILEFLTGLHQAKSGIENYFFRFQLKFLKIQGFQPQLDRCILCNGENINGSKLYFSINRGGYICINCKSNELSGILISQNTVKYLYLLENCESGKIHEIKNSKQVIKESTYILNKFMGYHIEGLEHLKSTKFLEQVIF